MQSLPFEGYLFFQQRDSTTENESEAVEAVSSDEGGKFNSDSVLYLSIAGLLAVVGEERNPVVLERDFLTFLVFVFFLN